MKPYPGRVVSGAASYKVLSAMLALGQFTMEELARYARVGLATARTVRAHSGQYLEEVTRAPTGRRGGQLRVFRVRPDQRAALRAAVDERFSSLGGAAAKVAHARSRAHLLGLLADQDLLLVRFPRTTDEEERRELFKLAVRSFEQGRAAWERAAARGDPADRQQREAHENAFLPFKM